MNALEYLEQCAVIEWCEVMTPQIPELSLINSSANGVRVPIGLAVKMKKAGMKAGFPDLNLPVARCGFHALYIEMKVKNNKQSADQRWWEKQLTAQGCAYWLSWSAREAIEVIQGYLDGRMRGA